MKTKPLSPSLHGVIDYVFSAALFAVPRFVGLNKKAKRFYIGQAINTAAYSAVTDYPLGIKHLIPYKTHRTVDCINIAVLVSATFYEPIRKDKRAVGFNLGMAAAALVTVLLTNWDAVPELNN